MRHHNKNLKISLLIFYTIYNDYSLSLSNALNLYPCFRVTEGNDLLLLNESEFDVLILLDIPINSSDVDLINAFLNKGSGVIYLFGPRTTQLSGLEKTKCDSY